MSTYWPGLNVNPSAPDPLRTSRRMSRVSSSIASTRIVWVRSATPLRSTSSS